MAKQAVISFIGAGNMGRSLIGGLLEDGYPAQCIYAAELTQENATQLQQQFGIQTTIDNHTAIAAADVVVLAVKPQVVPDLAQNIAASIQAKNPLLISIAAGIREVDLRRWLGERTAIVRCMPNTPALVGSGASALCANSNVSAEQREYAESIMRAVGLALWVENEDDLDIVTALSGSGPAYFFLVMEALVNGAKKLGLPDKTAQLLTLQTAFGAAKMALESDVDVAELRRRVTSPGGTTEAALNSLQAANIMQLFADALQAAQQRSVELAELLAKKA